MIHQASWLKKHGVTELADQITAIENRIGLGRATLVQIARTLEEYEIMTKQDLASRTKDLN
jgi:hypothetical protein